MLAVPLLRPSTVRKGFTCVVVTVANGLLWKAFAVVFAKALRWSCTPPVVVKEALSTPLMLPAAPRGGPSAGVARGCAVVVVAGALASSLQS